MNNELAVQSHIAHRTSPDYVQNSGEVIHVVLAVYDPSGSYSQHAGVVMTSIFENTKSKVVIHILHDDTLTDENRQKFIRTAEKYSQGLELHDVREQKKIFTSTAVELAKRRCSIGALYRLLIPDILNNLNKVVYLDCDLIVNLDIRDLWQINIDNYCLAGVLDMLSVATLSEALRDRINGCSVKTFVNSGVLVMNLEMIRKRGNLFQNSMTWIGRHVHLMKF